MDISVTLQNALKLKTALFDTCVLSTIRKNIKNPEMQDFLNLLNKLNCSFSVHDLVKLEYLRDANTHAELIGRKNFIEGLCEEFSLPVDSPQEMYSDAMVLSYIYVKHQIKGVDLVDLMSSAFLRRYSHQHGLVLVTENHKDFPPIIHDRIGSVVFSGEKNWHTFGFYRLDLSKWSEEVKSLLKSEEWNKK